MATRCNRCGGDGHVYADCPFCRGIDGQEQEHLSQVTCFACHNSGLLEEVCPECQGRGAVLAERSSAG